MKRTFSFIFVLSVALSACNLAAATPAALNQATLAAPAIQPTFTPIPPLAPTSALILPTPTQSAAQATAYPTPTALPAPQSLSSNDIVFDKGGTFKDIAGNVPANGIKTYKLGAMQGQVMSVSITGGYFPLEIRGRDGTTLCPAKTNEECSFWRGTLPLTQDYYVTVKSGGMGTDFTLRVAINPPGKAEQYFTFGDANLGITLTYADFFAPGRIPASLNNKTNLGFALQLIDTGSYVNTNLGEAYLAVGSSADPQVVSACGQPNNTGGAPEVYVGNVNINGYTFAYSTSTGVGAGNIYDQYIYRAVNNGKCYEAIGFVHYGNIGNYVPGVVKEYDLAGLTQKFNNVLATIQLK